MLLVQHEARLRTFNIRQTHRSGPGLAEASTHSCRAQIFARLETRLQNERQRYDGELSPDPATQAWLPQSAPPQPSERLPPAAPSR
jgi:hypothetical protein